MLCFGLKEMAIHFTDHFQAENEQYFVCVYTVPINILITYNLYNKCFIFLTYCRSSMVPEKQQYILSISAAEKCCKVSSVTTFS